MDMQTHINVGKTIIEQLGGRHFQVMTGAKKFSYNAYGNDPGITFRLPGSGGFTKNGINHVRIVLTPKDLYDITFTRIRGTKVSTIAVVNDVYNEDLRRVFTEHTGLVTSLGTMQLAAKR